MVNTNPIKHCPILPWKIKAIGICCTGSGTKLNKSEFEVAHSWHHTVSISESLSTDSETEV